MEALYVFFIFLLMLAIVTLIIALISLIFLTFLFRKMGISGWKAWIPVYNLWIILELGKLPGWLSLFILAPLVADALSPNGAFDILTIVATLANLAVGVFLAVAAYRIGKRMGKPGAFVLLAIFMPPAWVAILAFGKATWPKAQAITTPGAAPQVPPATPPLAPSADTPPQNPPIA